MSPRQRDLADYEDVFYATCAKTCELHESLAIRFESGFITPDVILHERGENLLSYAPFTAWEVLKYLEVTWSILLDPRLLVALDNAIRRNRVRHSQGVTLDSNFDPNTVITEISETRLEPNVAHRPLCQNNIPPITLLIYLYIL